MTLSSPPNRVFQFGDTDGTKDNTAISDSIQLNNLFDTGNCGGLDFTSGHSCTVNFVSNTGLATCITTGVIASSGSVVRQRMDWVNCNAGYYAPEDVTVTCSDSTGSYSKTSETFQVSLVNYCKSFIESWTKQSNIADKLVDWSGSGLYTSATFAIADFFSESDAYCDLFATSCRVQPAAGGSPLCMGLTPVNNSGTIDLTMDTSSCSSGSEVSFVGQAVIVCENDYSNPGPGITYSITSNAFTLDLLNCQTFSYLSKISSPPSVVVSRTLGEWLARTKGKNYYFIRGAVSQCWPNFETCTVHRTDSTAAICDSTNLKVSISSSLTTFNIFFGVDETNHCEAFSYPDFYFTCTNGDTSTSVTSDPFTLGWTPCYNLDEMQAMAQPPNHVFKYAAKDAANNTSNGLPGANPLALDQIFDVTGCSGVPFDGDCNFNYQNSNGLATCLPSTFTANSNKVIELDFTNCFGTYYAPEQVTLTCKSADGSKSATSNQFPISLEPYCKSQVGAWGQKTVSSLTLSFDKINKVQSSNVVANHIFSEVQYCDLVADSCKLTLSNGTDLCLDFGFTKLSNGNVQLVPDHSNCDQLSETYSGWALLVCQSQFGSSSTFEARSNQFQVNLMDCSRLDQLKNKTSTMHPDTSSYLNGVTTVFNPPVTDVWDKVNSNLCVPQLDQCTQFSTGGGAVCDWYNGQGANSNDLFVQDRGVCDSFSANDLVIECWNSYSSDRVRSRVYDITYYACSDNSNYNMPEKVYEFEIDLVSAVKIDLVSFIEEPLKCPFRANNPVEVITVSSDITAAQVANNNQFIGAASDFTVDVVSKEIRVAAVDAAQPVDFYFQLKLHLYDSLSVTSGVQIARLDKPCFFDEISLITETLGGSDIKEVEVDGISRMIVEASGNLMIPLSNRFVNNGTCNIDRFRLSQVTDLKDIVILEHPFTITTGGLLTGTLIEDVQPMRIHVEASSGVNWGGGDDYLLEVHYKAAEPMSLTMPLKVIFNETLPFETEQLEKQVFIREADQIEFSSDYDGLSFEAREEGGYYIVIQTQGLEAGTYNGQLLAQFGTTSITYNVEVHILITGNDEEEEPEEVKVEEEEQSPPLVFPGFKELSNDIKKVAEEYALKEEKVEPIAPQASMEVADEQGKISIEFNQDMLLPKNKSSFVYSQLLDVYLFSMVDGSYTKGNFVASAPTNKSSRLLTSKEEEKTYNCEGSCDGRQKSFEYYLDTHSPQKLSFQLIFKSASLVSSTGKDQDVIMANIKSPQFFAASDTGLPLEVEKIDNSFCPSAMKRFNATCKRIKPQISAEEAKMVEQQTASLGSAVNSAIASNLALTMLLGFALESLFGMVKQLTLFIIVGMIEVNYPAILRYFYQQIVSMLSLDLLQGPYWYEKIFVFKLTSPFSENFQDFDMPDMNFLTNSGSVVLLICLIIVSGISMSIIFRLAKALYYFRCCRKIAMHSEEKSGFVSQIVLVFTEGYIEVSLPAMLGIVAMYSNVDAISQNQWWLTQSDQTNSIITILAFTFVVLIPLWLSLLVAKHGANLEEGQLKETYGYLYESLNMSKKWARVWFVFDVWKRMLLAFALLTFDQRPVLMLQLTISFQLAGLMILMKSKLMFQEPRAYYMTVINELVLLGLVIVHSTFMFQSELIPNEEVIAFKKKIGQSIQYIIIVNFAINIAPVFKDMIYQTKDTLMGFYSWYHAKQKYEINLARRNRLIDNMSSLRTVLSRPEAIKFCQQFYQELQWCRKHDLDATILPENKQFYDLIKEHDLIHKKRQLEMERDLNETYGRMIWPYDPKNTVARKTQIQLDSSIRGMGVDAIYNMVEDNNVKSFKNPSSGRTKLKAKKNQFRLSTKYGELYSLNKSQRHQFRRDRYHKIKNTLKQQRAENEKAILNATSNLQLIDDKKEVTWADDTGQGSLITTHLICQMVSEYDEDPEDEKLYEPGSQKSNKKLIKQDNTNISSALVKVVREYVSEQDQYFEDEQKLEELYQQIRIVKQKQKACRNGFVFFNYPYNIKDDGSLLDKDVQDREDNKEQINKLSFLDDQVISVVDKSLKQAKRVVASDLPQDQQLNYQHAHDLVHYVNPKDSGFEFSFLYATLAVVQELKAFKRVFRVKRFPYKDEMKPWITQQWPFKMHFIMQEIFAESKVRDRYYNKSYTIPDDVKMINPEKLKQQIKTAYEGKGMWKEDNQPLPSEVLRNILERLDAETIDDCFKSPGWSFNQVLVKTNECYQCKTKFNQKPYAQLMFELPCKTVDDCTRLIHEYFMYSQYKDQQVGFEVDDMVCRKCQDLVQTNQAIVWRGQSNTVMFSFNRLRDVFDHWDGVNAESRLDERNPVNILKAFQLRVNKPDTESITTDSYVKRLNNIPKVIDGSLYRGDKLLDCYDLNANPDKKPPEPGLQEIMEISDDRPYKLTAIIEYVSDEHRFMAHTIKRRNTSSWWYSFTQDGPVKRRDLDAVLRQLDHVALLFYQRE